MPPAYRSHAADFAEAADYLTRRAEAGAALPPEDARRVLVPAWLPPLGRYPVDPEERASVADALTCPPLPTVRHDPAPTGDAGEEKAR